MFIPLALSLLIASAPVQSHPDKVLATRHIRGEVVGFEVADFQHVIIRGRKHKEDSYFIGGSSGLNYYMAVFAHKPGTFTVQKVNSYIEEAGGYQTIERVSGAKIAGVSFGEWWKKQRKLYKGTDDAIDNHFQPIVDKLTRKQ